MMTRSTTLTEIEITTTMRIGYIALHRSVMKQLLEMIKNKELRVVRGHHPFGVVQIKDLDLCTVGTVTGLRFKKGNSENTLTMKLKDGIKGNRWSGYHLARVTVNDPVRGVYSTFCIDYY